jgi:hypothetical protein
VIEECRSCCWWVSVVKNGKPTGRGDCHRYPPRTVEVTSESDGYGGQTIQSVLEDFWPTTDADEFCGEFKERMPIWKT